MTLTEFLLARIAEERAWAFDKRQHWTKCNAPSGGECSCSEGLAIRNRRAAVECEAKRLIVDEHRAVVGCCRVCSSYMDQADKYPCATLKSLALPYADHPDYRQDWAV